MLLRIHRSLSPDQGHRTSLYHLSTRQTLRRRQKSGGDSMSRPGFRRPQREGSEYALLSPGGAGTCANSARVILPVLRTMPFLSHCRGCVFHVKRKIFAYEDFQLCAANKNEKQACELLDQRISRAIFLRII